MYDDLYPALLKVHRDVFLPEFERIIHEAFSGLEQAMRVQIEKLRQRLDRVECPAREPPAHGPTSGK